MQTFTIQNIKRLLKMKQIEFIEQESEALANLINNLIGLTMTCDRLEDIKRELSYQHMKLENLIIDKQTKG